MYKIKCLTVALRSGTKDTTFIVRVTCILYIKKDRMMSWQDFNCVKMKKQVLYVYFWSMYWNTWAASWQHVLVFIAWWLVSTWELINHMTINTETCLKSKFKQVDISNPSSILLAWVSIHHDDFYFGLSFSDSSI